MGTLSQIDQLVTSGLTSPKNLAYTRIILSDPDTGIKNMIYRDLAVRLYTKIINCILNDAVLYQRLRSLLMQEPHLENLLGETPTEAGTDAFRKFAERMTPGQTLRIVKKVVARKNQQD